MRTQSSDGVDLFPLDLDQAAGGSAGCEHCFWWWAQWQVVDGRTVVREWHQRGCPRVSGGSVPPAHEGADRPPPGSTLAEVMTSIDDGDPLDAGVGGDVSVWEDPDRLTVQIWDALAVPMGLSFSFRDARPGRPASPPWSSGVSGAMGGELAAITGGVVVGGAEQDGTAMEVHCCVQRSPDPRMGPVRALGVRSYASFPLVHAGVLTGTFVVGSRTRSAFTDHEVLVLRALADCIADAADAADTAERGRATADR